MRRGELWVALMLGGVVTPGAIGVAGPGAVGVAGPGAVGVAGPWAKSVTAPLSVDAGSCSSRSGWRPRGAS